MARRNITLPPVHNTRAPEQWRIISEHVDFDGKTVLDLGCGYGDLLRFADCKGNALEVWGYESNTEILASLWQATHPFRNKKPIYMRQNIDDMVIAENAVADIIFCFSVLPYLFNPAATLHWMRKHSTQALIECQLAGDGPGFDWLKTSQDMRRWLDSIGWESVERIGWTVVKDRGTSRGIWLCSE